MFQKKYLRLGPSKESNAQRSVHTEKFNTSSHWESHMERSDPQSLTSDFLSRCFGYDKLNIGFS